MSSRERARSSAACGTICGEHPPNVRPIIGLAIQNQNGCLPKRKNIQAWLAFNRGVPGSFSFTQVSTSSRTIHRGFWFRRFKKKKHSKLSSFSFEVNVSCSRPSAIKRTRKIKCETSSVSHLDSHLHLQMSKSAKRTDICQFQFFPHQIQINSLLKTHTTKFKLTHFYSFNCLSPFKGNASKVCPTGRYFFVGVGAEWSELFFSGETQLCSHPSSILPSCPPQKLFLAQVRKAAQAQNQCRRHRLQSMQVPLPQLLRAFRIEGLTKQRHSWSRS